jgi:predicted NBD/HSP70 family sugar kinase
MNKPVTRSHIRAYNRKQVMHAIYAGTANNRAALAEETGLTKPTISDLVAELMDEGLLAEEGLGESTESGGKRPRLLRFLPEARQVIGVSLHQNYVMGVLTDLDRHIILQHHAELPSTEQAEVFSILIEVINGLTAQLTAPLLCLSVGIPALVNEDAGLVRHAPRFGWYNVPLATMLAEHYKTSVYLSNSPELAAKAQFAFNRFPGASSLATILISNSIGFGMVTRGASGSLGSDIGHLIAGGDPPLPLEQTLGWRSVEARARTLASQYESHLLNEGELSYLHIRYAVSQQDRAALTLCEELSTGVAQVFAWAVTLLRPQHLSLAGAIAALGEDFLQLVTRKTATLILPDLIETMSFSIDETENLVAIGAAAKAVDLELGIV